MKEKEKRLCLDYALSITSPVASGLSDTLYTILQLIFRKQSIDFQKAFESVHRGILGKKLQSVGMYGDLELV